MTRPRTEPRSPGPLANTLPIKPMARNLYKTLLARSRPATLTLTVSVEVLILFTPLEFFTSVLADGFSLEFE